jgi:hypothetical protein
MASDAGSRPAASFSTAADSHQEGLPRRRPRVPRHLRFVSPPPLSRSGVRSRPAFNWSCLILVADLCLHLVSDLDSLDGGARRSVRRLPSLLLLTPFSSRLPSYVLSPYAGGWPLALCLRARGPACAAGRWQQPRLRGVKVTMDGTP